MILPDGTDYPRDYVVIIETVDGRPMYRAPDGTRRPLRHVMTLLGQRETTAREDHPVVRAHDVIQKHFDISKPEHREMYLAFIALAVADDPHNAVTSNAKIIIEAIKEANKMASVEELQSRFEALVRKVDAIDAEMRDDARAQADAVARSESGVLTMQVDT